MGEMADSSTRSESRTCLSKHEQLMQRLYCLLQQLRRERRQAIISQQLSQAQRLCFEQWILKQQRQGRLPQMPRPKTGKACLMQRRILSRVRPPGSCSKAHVKKQGGSGRGGNSQRRQSKLRECSKSEAVLRGGRLGIASWTDRNGSHWHVASVVVENLQIKAGAVQDWKLATLLLDSLRSCQASLASCKATDETLETTLRSALCEAFDHRNIAKAMQRRLRYSVCVPARCWIGGSLKTPNMKDLSLACSFRRQLLEARGPTNTGERIDLATSEDQEAIWRRLSNLYAQACAEAGRDATLALEQLSVERAKRHAQEEARQAVQELRKQRRLALQKKTLEKSMQRKAEADRRRFKALQLRQAKSEARLLRKTLAQEAIAERRIAKVLLRLSRWDKDKHGKQLVSPAIVSRGVESIDRGAWDPQAL